MHSDRLRRFLMSALAATGCFVFASTLPGCEEKGSMEKAGEALDDAANDAADALEDAGDAAADAVEDAAEGVGDAINNATGG